MNHAFADDDLRMTRERLLVRGAELRDRLDRVRRDLAREAEPLPRDSSDAAIMLENDEILEAIQETASAELEHIHLALERMEAGTFARCEQCGAGISAERLRAVPYAAHCRECEED
jgi:RNA polymerase-binding transcription factor DksA